jgi:hypothetical protein
MRNKNKGEEKYVKFSTNRTKATSIVLLLMFAMAVSLVALPTANAFDPSKEIPTFAFVMAIPDPVGVGQWTYIYMWVDKTFDSTALNNDYRFHDYKLTITKPDGTTETKTWDVVWDSTSSQGFSYTPEQAGEYTLKFEFPGQAVKTYSHNPASDYVNYTYLASSAETTLTVQEEPVYEYPSSYPLPTEYWTRPIYGENPDWWSVSSDWLGTDSPQLTQADRYISDGVGPSTSHIMWTKPLQAGGVVGGDNFEIQGDTYFEGSAYISRYRNPMIINGKLYYSEPIGFATASRSVLNCVDLRTGEAIWSRDFGYTEFCYPGWGCFRRVNTPSFGYIYATHQPNQHGVMQPILYTSNFAQAFDADTAEPMYNVTNVPSGTSVFGPQGEILRYAMTNLGNRTHPNYYLAQWNSSAMHFGFGLTPTQSGEYDASASSNYDWNVSISWRNTMTSSPSVLGAWYNDIMICRNGSLPGVGARSSGVPAVDPYTYFAVNLNPDKGALGSVLWWNTVDAPENGISVLDGIADSTSRVFTESYKETMQWVGYDMDTGNKLWGPTTPQADLDYYGYFYPGLAGVPAYGNLYSSGMAGIVYCYDITTGDLLWTYGNGGEGNSTDSGFQVPGHYPTFIWAVANGIVYTMTTEHTIQTPIYKDARVRAINATDGTEIWTLSNYNGGGVSACALADGFATFFNGYDNQIYVVGKGPSATTVSASPEVSVHGSSVLVKGSVIDTAAGTAQDEQAARFPNGVPAVSDESMTEWMEYVYQQKPRPADTVGVEVVIEVLDPNNNFYEVGRATSDGDGLFHCAFTPEVPGEYTIIATFEGSEGYWPSHAETAINVEDVPAATPAPTPTPAPMTDMYVTGFGIGIIIAIAVVGLLLFMMLRRR